MVPSPRGLFLLLFVAGTVACSSGAFAPSLQPIGSSARSKATPAPHAVLPLHVNTNDKVGMNLELSVAGGSPRPFLFDTGSDGFWVYFNAVGARKNYTSTHLRAKIAYGSGIEYQGTVAFGKVAFERGYAAASAPFVIVDTASCTKAACPAQITPQNCPNVYMHRPNHHASIYCLEEGRGLWGTFGADLEPAVVPSPSPPATAPPGPVVLYNVLFGIAPWSNAFIVIVPRELQLGPAKRAAAEFTYVTMTAKPLPTALPNGARGWIRDVPLCYRIGSYLKGYCLPTLFDTGASDVRFETAAPFTIPTQPAGCRFVAKGLSFLLSRRDGMPIASFKTGYRANYNAVRLTTPVPGKTVSVNTGLTLYNRNEILFDAARGRVGFRALPSPGRFARKDCDGSATRGLVSSPP